MSTHTTSKYGFVVPMGDDLISNGDDLQRAWADLLDSIIATQDGGLDGSRPAFGKRGKFYWATDTGSLYFDTGSAWVKIRLSVNRREGRSFTMDDSTAPVTTGKLGDFWVPVATGQTTLLVSANHRIDSGTSVSWKLQLARAGVAAGAYQDITGWGTTASPIVTTSTTPVGALLDPADIQLLDGDSLAVVIVATAGSPKGFSLNINLEHQ